MGLGAFGGCTMRDETRAPTVPEVSSESFKPVVRADGGQQSFSEEGHVAEAPLVAQLS